MFIRVKDGPTLVKKEGRGQRDRVRKTQKQRQTETETKSESKKKKEVKRESQKQRLRDGDQRLSKSIEMRLSNAQLKCRHQLYKGITDSKPSLE